MFIPYLAFGCDSVDFNVERVRGYMANLCDVCGTNDNFRLTGSFGCDCPPLTWDPYSTNPDNPNLSIPVRYTNPAGNTTVLNASVTGATYNGGSEITYNAVNTFEVGQIVSISTSGATPAAWLMPTHFIITARTATTFTGYLPCTICDFDDPTPTDPLATTAPGTVYSSWTTVTASLHDEEPAPWYDADVAASGRFLGYIIEQFSGIESPVKREIVPKMSGSGGGIFGPYRNAPRQFQISALMFACDQEAMDYGFQYLKDALGYWACSKCETCDIEFATACQTFDTFPDGYYVPPSPTNVVRNRWNVYSVGLVEGPVYAEDPIPRVACNIRRVQFVIAAEDPWLYHCESDQGTFDLGLTGYATDPDPITTTILWDENTIYSGSTIPTATITNVSGSGSVVTYTATNTFNTGDIVTVTGITPDSYNVTNAVVALATSTYFTIESTTTGAATLPPYGTATLIARPFEHVQQILSPINIGEIAVNVTITNPSSAATYDVSVSLYPDSLGYKYWDWQSITGNANWATSTTSITINTGTVTLTTQANKGWSIGARVRAVSNTTIHKWIEGTVVSYSGTTLVLNIDSVEGEGTVVNNWRIGKPIPAGWEPPTPCARAVVSTIPAGYTFVINSSREQYTLISDAGETYDGTPYIKVEPGNIPEFLTARCGTYALGVSGSYTDVGQGTTVTVETQHREI